MPTLLPRRSAGLLAGLALLACKREPPAAAPAQGPAPAAAPAGRTFERADLAAATQLDAKLARVTLFASELSAAAEDGASAARERAKELAPRLATAVVDAEGALAAISYPADKVAAEPALAAARRWPALAVETAEGNGAAAGTSLAAARDALGKAVFDYRRSRTQYALAPSPASPAEADFVRARAELERVEAEAGARLPVAPRDEGHKLDTGSARLTAQAAAARAKEAAAALEPALRDPALRWTDAESRALAALHELSGADAKAQRRLSLAYQEGKADALDAAAELERARARR
jgi:hypothetical protein